MAMTTLMRRLAVLFTSCALALTVLATVEDSAVAYPPTPTDAAGYAQTIFKMINSERQAHRVPAVTWSSP